MKTKVANYVEGALADYKHEQTPSTLKKLLPILWFGDMNKYLTSEKKIVTVSLNPSNNEFGNIKKGLAYSTQYRFPDYDGNIESLVIAFNNYFKLDRNPYHSWFKV